MHYNDANRHLFVKGVKIYNFKIKTSEINAALLFLGNISRDFLVDNKKNWIILIYVYEFSVDYDSTDAADILNIHKHLIVKNNIK